MHDSLHRDFMPYLMETCDGGSMFWLIASKEYPG